MPAAVRITPCCCSTAPDGTPPPSSRSRPTSPRSSCLPAPPKLNPVENVWEFLRSNWLSNLVFDTYDEIIAAACDAWRNIEADPERITSIGMKKWAHIGHSP